MSTAASGNRLFAVVGAFVYLQATSLYNNLRQRLLRLRQPKYLFGALAGAAYLYAFVFRKMFHVGPDHAVPNFATSPDMLGDLSMLVAIGFALYLLLDWMWSGDDAQLGFSETEIAFLFPAPLTRTTLIQFNLLRSQLMIFFSSFLLSVLLRRGGALGGQHPLQYAVGLWLLLSISRLHVLAASFVCARLAGFGVGAWVRRILVAVLAALVVFACWWPLRGYLLPAVDRWSNIPTLHAWFQGIVSTAPLSWLLVPFHWAVAPIFAADGAAFLRALPAALGLLVLHYIWVVRAQVSFEDASIVHAERRAKKMSAMRDGRMRGRAPTKPRSEPFRLVASGFPPLAFLWKGLVAMGPVFRLRTWLISCVVAVALCQWLAADPRYKALLLILGSSAMMISAWAMLFGPMMMQRGVQRTLEYMDILKATPLRGRQIALGEMSTPTAVMVGVIWLLLLVAAQSFIATGGRDPFSPGVIATAAVGMALLVPPLCGLMLCVPFAGTLYFPAWVSPQKGGGRGVEVMGQRLIFMAGYMLTFVVVLIPAAVVGGLAFLLAYWLAGLAAGVFIAAMFGCAVLALELYWAIGLLGRRIDGFDVSQELR